MSQCLFDLLPALRRIALLGLTISTLPGASASEPPTLSLARSGPTLEFSWPAARTNASGAIERPYFEVQHSSDLRRWEPVGQRMRAASPMPGATLNVNLVPGAPDEFYRVLSISQPAAATLGAGGAEVYGYAEAFAQQLKRIGQISAAELEMLFPDKADYLPGLSWNPTNSAYWDAFNANLDLMNADKAPADPGFRTVDYRLNNAESTLFGKHGFVVSERLGGASFAEVFYDLWRNDLPVFISTDALLQAWHRTYDAILEEVEETCLFGALEAMLEGMAGQLPALANDAGQTALRDSLFDADYYLAVARSLLAGKPAPSLLGQNSRAAGTLGDIQSQELKRVDDFMGFCRMVDFSQFKVRGHYTHSERLGRYFKTMMWLGRIDLPVAGGPFERCYGDKRMASPRELGAAIVLWDLLNRSGQFDTWAKVERVTQTFVGLPDSMTFGQLGGLLAGARIHSVRDVPDIATLERLQADIAHGELGVQNIRSDWFYPLFGDAGQYDLPRTFTVVGQKFTPDSWVLSQVTFDSIVLTDGDTVKYVERRVPGALDVAFAVLKNDHVVPELIAQINGRFIDEDRPHATQWRDGFPYQHNLAAARLVIDQQTAASWQGNLYLNWLACLRELSAPTTGPDFPEAIRGRAWAMKTLNTQLASWTQLRHDTILYAKQSYTRPFSCLYPTGFVEPRLAFWSALGQMSRRAADLIASLPFEGFYTIDVCEPDVVDPQTGQVITPGRCTNRVSLADIQAREIAHLANFAGVIHRLEALTAKELAHQRFTTDDQQFIDGLMEQRSGIGCTGTMTYSGWYPGLFYRAIHWDERTFHEFFGAGALDALVADVHTDVPRLDGGDPGSVLHEAVGRVNLLLMAVDNGADRFVCAGPVLSHHEVEVVGPPRRLDDNEWQTMISGGFPSDVPVGRVEGLKPALWTGSYLVPR